jgi:hypothetical protein
LSQASASCSVLWGQPSIVSASSNKGLGGEAVFHGRTRRCITFTSSSITPGEGLGGEAVFREGHGGEAVKTTELRSFHKFQQRTRRNLDAIVAGSDAGMCRYHCIFGGISFVTPASSRRPRTTLSLATTGGIVWDAPANAGRINQSYSIMAFTGW